MRPFHTVLLATGLCVVALGTWWGFFLLPVALVASLTFALKLLVSFFARDGNPLRELGWLLLCVGALPAIFIAREVRMDAIQERWEPTIAALNAGATPHEVEVPDDECQLQLDDTSWRINCQLTPPFERMSWEPDDQRWYVWD